MTVGVNGMSVVHKGSGGVSIAPVDVCKMQAGPAVVPLPLPNIAKSEDLAKGTRKVKCDGFSVAIDGSVFSQSTGDEAGSLGGVVSGKTKGKAELVLFSMDVKFEGKGVARAMDTMLHNDKNTPPAPILQGPVVAAPESPDAAREEQDEEEECRLCKKPHGPATKGG